MGHQSVLLVIFVCYHLLLVKKVQSTRYPSKEGELDVEIRTNFLDKSSIKTVQDKYGHKLPGRTIPITDLIKDRQVSETAVPNRPNTYLAVARTKRGSGKYSGGGCYLKLENPRAVGQQFSTTRIRLQAEYDSIEAGWRVDPDLYGDSQTRFFIRTDAGKTHCFNTRCPGFILTDVGFQFDGPLTNISKPGGPLISLPCFMVTDNANGNWILQLGKNKTEIGYWPSSIFTGLASFADVVEWGGAAYSPPGTPLPPMGSGHHPTGRPKWDGTISFIKTLDESGKPSDVPNIELYATNSKLYTVQDGGYHPIYGEHVIYYGGAGHL